MEVTWTWLVKSRDGGHVKAAKRVLYAIATRMREREEREREQDEKEKGEEGEREGGEEESLADREHGLYIEEERRGIQLSSQ